MVHNVLEGLEVREVDILRLSLEWVEFPDGPPNLDYEIHFSNRTSDRVVYTGYL